jgi:hypothetical protein
MINGQSQVLTKTLNANGSMVIPAGHTISHGIFCQETANHAITGGIRIGTTGGGTNIMVAQAVGALALVDIRPASILLRYFSMTVDQTIFIEAVTNWNGASINIQIPVDELAGL